MQEPWGALCLLAPLLSALFPLPVDSQNSFSISFSLGVTQNHSISLPVLALWPPGSGPAQLSQWCPQPSQSQHLLSAIWFRTGAV